MRDLGAVTSVKVFICICSGKSAITALSHNGRKNGDFIALPCNEIAKLTKSTADFAFTRVFIFSMIRTGPPVFINADQAICSASVPHRVKIEENKTATGNPAAHICGHDGIGRHARFRYLYF